MQSESLSISFHLVPPQQRNQIYIYIDIYTIYTVKNRALISYFLLLSSYM